MGIDIGTSGCKAVVFDEHGLQASSAYREYNLLSPECGWAELDPDEVMEKCFDELRDVKHFFYGRAFGYVWGQGVAMTAVTFHPFPCRDRQAPMLRDFTPILGREKI